MERERAIPQKLMLVLMAAGVAVAQIQSPRVSPGGEPQSRVQQPQVAPAPPANQGNTALTPVVQIPVIQSTTTQPPQVQPVVLPPSQMLPSPPRISYVGGKLTVVANNATLDDVLIGVGKAIGANIQGSEPESGERVFGQFGPASPSQVLNALLIGSRYDFILVGATESADSVRELILSRSSGDSAQAAQFATLPSPVQDTNRRVSSSLVNNQQPQDPPLSPEEQAGFRPNHRGPGARAIVRPRPFAPGTSSTPQQTDVPLLPQ